MSSEFFSDYLLFMDSICITSWQKQEQKITVEMQGIIAVESPIKCAYSILMLINESSTIYERVLMFFGI